MYMYLSGFPFLCLPLLVSCVFIFTQTKMESGVNPLLVIPGNTAKFLQNHTLSQLIITPILSMQPAATHNLAILF